MDFFDILLAKKLEDDRDPKVEGLSVTANGTYSEDGVVYKPVVVNVPETPLSSLTVTENRTYTAPTGTGYNEVSVNVPLPENAYLLEEYSDVPTDIASFTASDAPLKSLTVSIEPVQAGSGDPSPTNVRPISGWSGAEIFDDPVYGGVIDWNQLRADSYNSQSQDGITTSYNVNTHKFTIKNDSRTTNFMSGSSRQNISTNVIVGHKYCVFGTNVIGVGIIKNNFSPSTTFLGTNNVFEATTTEIILRVTPYYDFVTEHPVGDETSFYLNIVDLTQMFGSTKADEIYAMEQAEAGSGVAYFKSIFPDDYYAYNTGTKTCVSEVNNGTYRHYSIPFTDSQGNPVEVYGGSVDVVSGIVTPAPYYASYNGETLTGEWISDRDVYSPNTSPTIGAQVVNIGATGTPFNVQPTSIKSLDGVNNVFASTGQIEDLEFFTKETS